MCSNPTSPYRDTFLTNSMVIALCKSTAETTDPVYRIAEFTFENKQPKFFESPSFSLLRASWQYPNTLSPILVISV